MSRRQDNHTPPGRPQTGHPVHNRPSRVESQDTPARFRASIRRRCTQRSAVLRTLQRGLPHHGFRGSLLSGLLIGDHDDVPRIDSVIGVTRTAWMGVPVDLMAVDNAVERRRARLVGEVIPGGSSGIAENGRESTSAQTSGGERPSKLDNSTVPTELSALIPCPVAGTATARRTVQAPTHRLTVVLILLPPNMVV